MAIATATKTTVTAADAENNIFQLIEDVNVNSTPITITVDKGENAVLVGENDWNSIKETLYLMSIPGMTQSIVEGKNTPVEDCVDGSEVW